jgi:hypothetical protein
MITMTFRERVERSRERSITTWIEDAVAVGSSIAVVFLLFIFMLLLCG